MSNSVETNAKEVYDKFVDLELKEMKKAIKAGITKNRTFLRNKARGYFKSDYPNAAKIGKFKDSMIQGVRYYKKIYEDKEGDMMGIVSIGSNFKSGSGSYRIVMFENGTKNRTNKRNQTSPNPSSGVYNRGKIKASHFFKRANTDLEQVQVNNLIAAINKTIEKLNKTKI